MGIHKRLRLLIAIRNYSSWIQNMNTFNKRRQTNQWNHMVQCFRWRESLHVLQQACLSVPGSECWFTRGTLSKSLLIFSGLIASGCTWREVCFQIYGSHLRITSRCSMKGSCECMNGHIQRCIYGSSSSSNGSALAHNGLLWHIMSFC